MSVIFVVIYFALFALVLYRARSPVTSDFDYTRRVLADPLRLM